MERERKVEIRVRVMGRKVDDWRIYPPEVLDMTKLQEKLGILFTKWNQERKSFYIHNELELLKLIKILSQGIADYRINREKDNITMTNNGNDILSIDN